MADRSSGPATLQDIAQRTGFSVATVSRALHREGSPNVSDETRRRVREVADSVGYRPNILGRSLATGKTFTVSYWTHHAFAPYYSMIAGCAAQEGELRGYHMVLNDVKDAAVSLKAAGTGVGALSPLASMFDGVVACDVAYSANDYARELIGSRRIPVVGIGVSVSPTTDYVKISLKEGSELMMAHLLSTGARRIAHMGHADALYRQDPRAVVYDRMMRESGLQPEWIGIADHWRRFARVAVKEYVAVFGAPEAIFCVNDEVAIGCYRGLADIGLEVPNDVLITGCDGLEETEYHRCPITTLVAPAEEMCRLAWDILEERMQSVDGELQQRIVRPKLVIRESTTGRHTRI